MKNLNEIGNWNKDELKRWIETIKTELVLVMRETTERPEGVAAGCVKVIGTDKANIIDEVEDLLKNQAKYTKMSQAKNPYGDGQASQRIVQRLLMEIAGGQS